jgi:hypothetical protein
MGGRLRGTSNGAAFVLVLLSVFAPGLSRAADAVTLSLQWDSNLEGDIAGYVVDYGTQSGQLFTSVDVGNHTSHQFTDLETGRTYYFAVRAYNTKGVASAASVEVSASVGMASMSLTNLAANLTPPQRAGATVIFAAAASGGAAPYQYKWFVSDGTRPTMVRDWSADNTLTWQPQSANPSYVVSAWARGASNKADAPENASSERAVRFAIISGDTTVINLVADREAPQPPATPITLAATAKGGTATYEFQWSLFDGATWAVLQGWSSNGRFTWTPTVANPKYQVMVRVRGGQSLAANTGITMPFPVQ